MASTKDLKKRIGTVKNTQQTTRAMKMVSAAKLRRAQDAINNQRPYARQIGEMISRLFGSPEVTINSPFLGREESADGSAGKKLLILVVTSDRGLCGGFNANVMKGAQRYAIANRANYSSIHFAFVGRKGYEFFKNRGVEMGPYFQEQGGKVSFAKAKKVADTLVEQYLAGEYDEVKVVYNEFKNAVTQMTKVEAFLPIEPVTNSEGLSGSAEGETMYIVKPSPTELLEDLLAKNFAIQIFRVMLESQAGEHGARMSSMENATKNAGEMIKKLTLEYNKQRQAGITKELLEIISGSESQKAG